ncbi:MAG: hypothetical protein M1134_01225 [Actinobacteria bacterium]|nr:hypothetical protein [Actinomycetota bacterium]MCL5445267.1 hypothetical protein [Actinomycetota bacterium]
MTSEDSRSDKDRELQMRPRSIVRRPKVLAITGGVVALVVVTAIGVFATSGPGGPPYKYPPPPPIPANGPVPKVTPIPPPWGRLTAEFPGPGSVSADAVNYNNNSVSAETYYKAPLCQPRDLKVDLVPTATVLHPGGSVTFYLEIFNHSSRGCDILASAPLGNYTPQARNVPAARCLPTYFITNSSGRLASLDGVISGSGGALAARGGQCLSLGAFIRAGTHFTGMSGWWSIGLRGGEACKSLGNHEPYNSLPSFCKAPPPPPGKYQVRAAIPIGAYIAPGYTNAPGSRIPVLAETFIGKVVPLYSAPVTITVDS